MAEVAKAKVNAELDGSNDETDKSDENASPVHNKVISPDGLLEHMDRSMEVESPSSELENLTSSHYEESDSGESEASGKQGMYVVNADTDNHLGSENKENEGDKKDNRASLEPVEKKLKTDKGLPDVGGKLSDSRPASVASSGGKSSTPGREKDPAKKEKDKDREERIRQAQLRLAEERQRKIEEMREQQRMAQENREKQLEARRKKIEDLKRREEERRKQVEERRKTQDEIDKAKKEAILNKAKERLTRYEQWKAHGRKGYPGESPPSKQLSMSTSVLYQKKSSDFSSTGAINKVGTSNLRSGAESLMALNTIPENRLRRSLPASMPPTRHKSAVNIATSGVTGVKMRDPNKMSPRKQRPYSVATSMPSFVPMDSDGSRHSRSKSTDRGVRDASKTRTPGRKEDEKTDSKEKKAATLPRPYDRKKIEERRLEAEKKREERKEREKEREKERQDRMSKSETQEKEKHPAQKTLSKSFIERMSTPKHPSAEKKETGEKETSPVKTSTPKVKAKPQRDSPSKSPSKSSLKDTKTKDDSSKSDSPKSLSPVPSKSPAPKETPVIQVEEVTEGDQDSDKPESATSDMPSTEPTVKFAEPEVPKPSPKPKAEPKQVSPEPKSQKSEQSTSKTDKEREMEEYKNKLAEKRRLAREKAEREAEIERIRQEEQRRQEEERLREEEERQRREEEEALRLAEENRKAEEERLAKAIEAEEKRKKEEAERLEQERIQREEAEKKAKEEAERLEKERQEKARKEEEEKIERKKRLESVMKRFKPDSPASTPEKPRTESPPRPTTTASSSGRASLVSSEDEKGDDSEKEEKASDKLDIGEEPPKFKSPLLQNLTKVKPTEGESGTPKFKSPLLQSIMAKTKLGARLSSSKLDELGKSNENLTTSTDTLSDDDKVSAEQEQKESLTESVVNGHGGHSEGESIAPVCDSDKDEGELQTNNIEVEVKSDQVDDKIVDNGYTPELGGELDSVIQSRDTPVKVSDGESDKEPVTDSQITVESTADSAVSLSFNGVSAHNGDLHIEPKELIESKELVDSSISMRTADSFASSQTGSIGGSLVDSQNLPASDSTQFEEVIDLNLHVTNKTLKAQQLAENLINFNLNDNDDITMSGSSESPTHSLSKPIIAFEDNATRRQDVPDVNASDVVATDLSSNQLSDHLTMENHHNNDAIGASQHSHQSDFDKVRTTGKNSQVFSNHLTYLTKQHIDHNQDTAGAQLEDDPELLQEVDRLWSTAEGIMGNKFEDTCKVLEVYGIGEGEDDSETEEGQLWRMVQGNAPYTLNLV